MHVTHKPVKRKYACDAFYLARHESPTSIMAKGRFVGNTFPPLKKKPRRSGVGDVSAFQRKRLELGQSSLLRKIGRTVPQAAANSMLRGT